MTAAEAPAAARRWRPGAGALVLPMAVFLAVVYAEPVVRVLATSVSEPQWGLHHYIRIFERAVYLQVLANTLWLAAIVAVASAFVAYPIAYYLTVAPPWQARALLFLLFVPFWTSIIVRNFGLMLILGRTGVVNTTLIDLGLIDQPIQFMFNTTMVRVAMVQILLPFYVLPLYSVMRGVDRSLLRAAAGLGAPPLQVFLRVFLPLSKPGLFAGGLLVFVLSLGFFITPALVGGRQDMTIAMLILSQFEATLDWGFGAALSALLLIATLIAIAFATRAAALDRVAAMR